jgi:hypothetical protein
MSAFGGKADMTICGNPLSRSLLGAKRTCPFALHMSANDPRLTLTQPLPLKIFHRLLARRGIAAVGSVLRNTRGDCPKPLLILRPLRVEHDTADVPIAFEQVIFVH